MDRYDIFVNHSESDKSVNSFAIKVKDFVQARVTCDKVNYRMSPYKEICSLDLTLITDDGTIKLHAIFHDSTILVTKKSDKILELLEDMRICYTGYDDFEVGKFGFNEIEEVLFNNDKDKTVHWSIG